MQRQDINYDLLGKPLLGMRGFSFINMGISDITIYNYLSSLCVIKILKLSCLVIFEKKIVEIY